MIWMRILEGFKHVSNMCSYKMDDLHMFQSFGHVFIRLWECIGDDLDMFSNTLSL